jgi:hypothetical protein
MNKKMLAFLVVSFLLLVLSTGLSPINVSAGANVIHEPNQKTTTSVVDLSACNGEPVRFELSSQSHSVTRVIPTQNVIYSFVLHDHGMGTGLITGDKYILTSIENVSDHTHQAEVPAPEDVKTENFTFRLHRLGHDSNTDDQFVHGFRHYIIDTTNSESEIIYYREEFISECR